MNQQLDILRELLRANDLGWLIDMVASPSEALTFLLKRLREVEVRYRARIGVDVSFAPETLEAESARNPHKIRAFLQALGSTHDPDMLVMVWRILQGLSIRAVEMTYRELTSFHLRVVLARPGEGQDQEEIYETKDDEINDAALLRHFGIAKIGNQPLFDGFFPLHLKSH
jgi:hypothetical protein